MQLTRQSLCLPGKIMYSGALFAQVVRILPDFADPGKGQGDEKCQCWRKSGGSNGVLRVFIKTRV